MSDPVTATYIVAAVAAAGAAATTVQQGKALQKQQDAADANTVENYRVASENERELQKQASEKMTDRMREAQRRLSMARLIDAEGGASFASQAININAGTDEDIARIGASVEAAGSGIRDDVNALRVGAENAQASLSTQAAAIRTRFLTDTASTAASAYVGGERRKAELKVAQKHTADYRVR